MPSPAARPRSLARKILTLACGGLAALAAAFGQTAGTGALQGPREEDAFFVRCDRTTMTQADIDAGRLICQIGVAPVKPAEYVIVRIFQKTREATA